MRQAQVEGDDRPKLAAANALDPTLFHYQDERPAIIPLLRVYN